MRFLTNSWKGSGKFRFGVLVLGALMLIAVLAPLVYRPIIGDASPARPGMFPRWLPPSPQHPLGTEGHGRDTLTDFLGGLQTTLFIGFFAGLLATAVGVIVGFVSGYEGGVVDTALISVTNILLVIPAYPILVGLTLVLSNKSMITVGLIVALFSWPFAARTIRAQVLSMKEQPYVELAKVTGQSDFAIIFTEILPNLLPYVLMSFAFSTVGAMVAEVGIAVIGLGPSDAISLGMLINFASGWGAFTRGLYLLLLGPPAILILIFLALTMINRGLEEYLNPRLQNVTGQ